VFVDYAISCESLLWVQHDIRVEYWYALYICYKSVDDVSNCEYLLQSLQSIWISFYSEVFVWRLLVEDVVFYSCMFEFCRVYQYDISMSYSFVFCLKLYNKLRISIWNSAKDLKRTLIWIIHCRVICRSDN
jgi:hypothetical protein